MNTDPARMRRDYRERSLLESDAGDDPFALFGTWFAEAVEGGVVEPNAMTLATVSEDGWPAARTVLLKGWDVRGFVFYTNYESGKGRDLSAHPRAALVFWWAEHERQVRITGEVERIEHSESLRYFESRPRESRLGAWASRQSRVVASREELEARFAELDARYSDEIPKPPYWGGYRVMPRAFEYWQGGSGRMHDRLRYRREGGQWIRERLAP
ncbi:MAG: pyridoxamine 5'-phosphate oxidase [Deltaproteobacteria bacterium]|nr:MAG: pyridoxamine 5'-phosphate oxidase [Deltaproteobacteria bacterium]